MLQQMVYIDTETTGLDPYRHQVWEVAVAWDEGVPWVLQLEHSVYQADPEALRINRYRDRYDPAKVATPAEEALLRQALADVTLVGSNPEFDARMLFARWRLQPWNHRTLNLGAYAAGVLGLDYPLGLASLCDRLGVQRVEEHAAAGDVLDARECHRALRRIVAERAA